MNILLVEDDVGIARFVTRGLVARGHTVAWEREGAGVQAKVAGECFGAILLDLGLPDRDGLELCRALRQDQPGLPILMLTARDSLDDKLDGFDAGADDYLPKPFAFEELLARLRVLERRGNARPTDPIRFGALTLDRVERTAEWNGRPIPLDRRGFDFLHALALAKGAIVGRDALMETIWDSTDVSDNAIDVNISALRRRLAMIGSMPAIETFRGRGFRLKA